MKQKQFYNHIKLCKSRLNECENRLYTIRECLKTTVHIDPILAHSIIEDEDEQNRVLKHAAEAEELVNNDPMFLVYQCLIAAWSYLEACIYDSATEWLAETKFKTASDEILKIELPFNTVQNKSLFEKADILIRTYEMKKGRISVTKKWENLINVIGWDKSGKEYRKFQNDIEEYKEIYSLSLHEFSKVRNLIVHKAGIADATFLKEVPKRNDKLKEPIFIEQIDFHRYLAAAKMLISEIEARAKDCENRIK